MKFNHCSRRTHCHLHFVQCKTDVAERVTRLTQLGWIYTISDSAQYCSFASVTTLFLHLVTAPTSRFLNKCELWHQLYPSPVWSQAWVEENQSTLAYRVKSTFVWQLKSVKEKKKELWEKVRYRSTKCGCRVWKNAGTLQMDFSRINTC